MGYELCLKGWYRGEVRQVKSEYWEMATGRWQTVDGRRQTGNEIGCDGDHLSGESRSSCFVVLDSMT